MTLLKITTDDKLTRLDVPQGSLFQRMQEELGGYAEIVRPKRLYTIPNLPDSVCMVVDEEGLIKHKGVNVLGSYLYETDVHGSPIVGDILIADMQMGCDGPELTGLDDVTVDLLINRFTKAGIVTEVSV